MKLEGTTELCGELEGMLFQCLKYYKTLHHGLPSRLFFYRFHSPHIETLFYGLSEVVFWYHGIMPNAGMSNARMSKCYKSARMSNAVMSNALNVECRNTYFYDVEPLECLCRMPKIAIL
jgi:hypothetical protein